MFLWWAASNLTEILMFEIIDEIAKTAGKAGLLII